MGPSRKSSVLQVQRWNRAGIAPKFGRNNNFDALKTRWFRISLEPVLKPTLRTPDDVTSVLALRLGSALGRLRKPDGSPADGQPALRGFPASAALTVFCECSLRCSARSQKNIVIPLTKSPILINCEKVSPVFRRPGSSSRMISSRNLLIG